MENLACALFVFAVYCLWACASRPTVNTAADPAAPVDYFPEVEEVTEPEVIAVEPVTVEFQPTAEVIVEPIKKPSVAVPTDLTNLSIRQLKKLASAAKIKRYSNLTKAQLIDRLAALEVVAIARKAA
jgi:hypothetical protein